VLIVPGLFAIAAKNYRPFVTHGLGGFMSSLAPLFFSYAGFESLAQTAGEVKDSTKRLPMIFLKGIGLTALVFVLMSVVAFGVLPGAQLQSSTAPMVEVASVYLSGGGAWFVGFGAIMAITTSMNSTMLVPSRLAIILARDGLAPNWLGAINERTGTPVRGLTLTLAGSCVLLLSGQISLALNVAIFALVILYFLHSMTYLLLARRNPALARSITVHIPSSVQRLAAWISLLSMGTLIAIQIFQDLRLLQTMSLQQRIASHSLTNLELMIAWGAIGLGLYAMGTLRGKGSLVKSGEV
jgi:basic amino acid/polyamine antiporter, APA family